MNALEHVFNAKDYFHDQSCLVLIFLELVYHSIRQNHPLEEQFNTREALLYTLVLILPRQYLQLSVHS